MNPRHLRRIGATGLVWALFAGPAVSARQGQVAPNAPDSQLKLSLEDAVRRAIEHNPDLAIVRLGVDADAARVSESASAYRPVVSTTVGRSSSVGAGTNLLLGTGGLETRDLFATAGIRQRLRQGGGTWSVSWDASRTSTNNPFTTFEPSLQSGLQLAFSQPLGRDRRIDAARFQYAITSRNQASSDRRFKEAVVQTVAAVKMAYWTYKATLANVTVQQRSLELAEDLVRQAKARVAVGEAPPIDQVQTESEVASRRESLIRAETAARDAEDRLRRLIVDPADASFWRVRLDPTDDPAVTSLPADIEAAVATALGERHDLARARNDVDNAATTVKFLTDQKRPDVRLEASYRGGGAGGTQLVRTGPFPGSVTGRLETGFGDVLGQLFSRDFPTWSLGVTVSYPLGRSYEEAGLARAEIERRQAALRIASLQTQITEAIRQAARQVESTAERMDAARAGEKLADQRLNVEQRRFGAGLSTTFLITQAQRDLLQAQVALLQATLEHQSALVAFEAVQLAPLEGGTVGLSGASVVAIAPQNPLGMFRR